MVDEAARIAPAIWTNTLRPALADCRGRALFLSTGKGKRSWFYDLYLMGMDPSEPEYASFNFPSWANTALFPGGRHDPEIIALEKSLPSPVFRQEIAGEFLDDGGEVFRGLAACLRGPILDGSFPWELSAPSRDKVYFAGIDLGRLADFTTVVVLDQEGAVCYLDRINRVEWSAIRKRIVATAARYNNAEIALDATGIGDAILEELEKAKLRVRPVKFSNVVKNDLVSNLAVMIENGAVALPRHPTLISELEAFQVEITPGGRITYNAASGHHDDLVCGLMLAVSLFREGGGGYNYRPGYNPFPPEAGIGKQGRRSVLYGPEDF